MKKYLATLIILSSLFQLACAGPEQVPPYVPEKDMSGELVSTQIFEEHGCKVAEPAKQSDYPVLCEEKNDPLEDYRQRESLNRYRFLLNQKCLQESSPVNITTRVKCVNRSFGIVFTPHPYFYSATCESVDECWNMALSDLHGHDEFGFRFEEQSGVVTLSGFSYAGKVDSDLSIKRLKETLRKCDLARNVFAEHGDVAKAALMSDVINALNEKFKVYAD